MARTKLRLPAGPSGLPLIGRHLTFVRDPLGFLDEAHRRYGDLVTLPLNGQRIVAAFGPQEAGTVTDAYGAEVEITVTGGLDLPALRRDIQGRGPLNSTGEAHSLYRTVCLRALGGESARVYAEITAELTGQMLDGWAHRAEVELMGELSELTGRIFKYYMFGSDIARTAPGLNASVDNYIGVLRSTSLRLGSTLLPFDVPGLSRRGTLRRHFGAMDRCLEDHARNGRSSLAAATGEALARSGARPETALVRELMLQLYFAGVTSLPSTLAWTLLLLALHPGPARRLLDELHEVLDGRLPGPADTRRLIYLDAVLNESMRLYPGNAYDVKRIEGRLVVGGYELPDRFPVMLAPWVTHRSAACFDEPERFAPERFLDRADRYPKGAFAPWGVGDRLCIGKALGLSALRAILSAVVQRYRLEIAPGQRIDPAAVDFGSRLLPRPGVRMRPVPQDGETERSVAPVRGSVVGAAGAGQRGPDRRTTTEETG